MSKTFIIVFMLLPFLSKAAQDSNSLIERNYPPKDTTVTMESSNLPVIWIQTTGSLSRTERILGFMKVINNGTVNYTDAPSFLKTLIHLDFILREGA